MAEETQLAQPVVDTAEETRQPQAEMPQAQPSVEAPQPAWSKAQQEPNPATPTWQSVEESDSYKNATPQERLVAFDRWHNLAYNTATQAPNWNDIQGEFNKRAFDIQQKLTDEAGGMDPHTARLTMAKAAADQFPNDPEKQKQAVAQLGEDVAEDWAKPPTLTEQLMRPLNAFGNAFGRSLGETMKLAGYVGEEGYRRLTGEEGKSWIGALGDRLVESGNRLDEAADPRTRGGISEVVGSNAGSLLEMMGETMIGGEALKGMALARKAQLGLKEAESVKQLAGKLAGIGVFAVKNAEVGVEEGKAQGATQDQILKMALAQGAIGAATGAFTPFQKWLGRFDEKLGGGLTATLKKAITEGGQFSVQMAAQNIGNNVAVKNILGSDVGLLQDTIEQAKAGGVTGVVASIVLSALAHGKGAFVEGKPRPTAPAGDLEKLAPKTAAAQEKVAASATAKPAYGFDYQDGKPVLNAPPNVTAEQLDTMRKGIESSDEYTAEEKAQLLPQVEAAITERGGVKEAGKEVKEAEKPTAESPAAQAIVDKTNAGLAALEGEARPPETKLFAENLVGIDQSKLPVETPTIVGAAWYDPAHPEIEPIKGEEWNTPHVVSMSEAEAAGMDPKTMQPGFIIKNPDGSTRFTADREEAHKIAASAPGDQSGARFDKPLTAARAEPAPEARPTRPVVSRQSGDYVKTKNGWFRMDADGRPVTKITKPAQIDMLNKQFAEETAAGRVKTRAQAAVPELSPEERARREAVAAQQAKESIEGGQRIVKGGEEITDLLKKGVKFPPVESKGAQTKRASAAEVPVVPEELRQKGEPAWATAAEPAAPVEKQPAPKGLTPAAKALVEPKPPRPPIVTISDTVSPQEEQLIERSKRITERAQRFGRLPTASEIRSVDYERKSREQKAQQDVEGRAEVQRVFDEDHVVLTRSEIADLIGGPENSERVTEFRNSLLAEQAKRYPPEPLQPGEKEVAKQEAPPVEERSAEIDQQIKKLLKQEERIRVQRLPSAQTPKAREAAIQSRRDALQDVRGQMASLREQQRDIGSASRKSDRHPETGNFLPTVQDESGNTRPKFTNNPYITAQQLDVGLFDPRGNRMYVPTDFVEQGKIHPNIHVEFDPEVGEYHVTSIDAPLSYTYEDAFNNYKKRTKTIFARVSEPGQFSEHYNFTKVGEKAEPLVYIDATPGAPTLELINSGKSKLLRSFEDLDTTEIMPQDHAIGKHDFGAIATQASAGVPSIEVAERVKRLKANEDILDQLNWDKNTEAGRTKRVITAISEGKAGATKPQQMIADLILKSGLDLDNLPLRAKVDTSYEAGYRHREGAAEAELHNRLTRPQEGPIPVDHDLFINPELARDPIKSLLHESIHAATLMKLDPEYRYKLTKPEQNAVAQLEKLYERAKSEWFKQILGREAVPADVKVMKDFLLGSKDLDKNSDMYKGIVATYPDLVEHAYGMFNFEEFVTEALGNEKFSKILAGMSPHPDVKNAGGNSLFKSLLHQLRQVWMKLMNKGELPPQNSLASQTLEHALTMLREAGDIERTGKVAPVRAEETLARRKPLISQEELRAARGEKEPTEEGKVITEGKETAPTEATPAPAEPTESDVISPEETAVITDRGWLAPNGDWLPAPEGHDPILDQHAEATNPELANKLDNLSVEEYDQRHEFAVKAGYLRIVGAKEGQPIHIEGNPTPSQRRLLRDAALMQRSSVIQDLGGGRERVIVQAQANVPRPVAGPVRLTTRINEEGKKVRDFEIHQDATATDLMKFSDSLDQMNIPDNDKRRMKNRIAAALGEEMVNDKEAMKFIKDAYHNVDSVQTLANRDSLIARNDVIISMGGDPTRYGNFREGRYTKEVNDRLNSMPFVIEQSKEELQAARERIANANVEKLPQREKDKWLPIIDYAIENYDDLKSREGEFVRIMKEQLNRERANGIETGELEKYVTHLLKQVGADKPTGLEWFQTALGLEGSTQGGAPIGGRYFMGGRQFKTFTEALEEGYVPSSKGKSLGTNLADLAQKRVEMGQRLVRMKAWERQLANTKMPDGRPMIASMEPYENFLGEKGYQRKPKGYDTVLTGSKPLVVAEELAPMFNALFGRSALSGNKLARFIQQAAGVAKRYTLLFDTYHVGRVLAKELAFGGHNAFDTTLGYKRGLSILEYSPEAMEKMKANGWINQAMFDYAEKYRPIANLLMEHGLNVGRVNDNLVAQHQAAVPFIKHFNPWVFSKLSRGAMLQASIDTFERQMKNFPERGVEGNARQTAKEMNEVFGNMQSQSLFKNRTWQDLNRVALLAPQWAESQLKSEIRGYGQMAKAPIDLLQGKFRLGNVARGQLRIVLGMLAAGQVMNYLSKGHSTFENEKKEHMLDAYIPNFSDKTKPGFWFSPFEIGSEYAMMAHRYYAQHMTPVDIMTRIMQNKLGPLARGVGEAFTGRDYAGRKFESEGDRFRAMVADTLPFPMPLTGAFEKDPRGMFPYRFNRQPGSGEKQLLQMAGLKLANEQTPRAETFALAHPFREDQSYSDRASPYRELRKALDVNNMGDAESEVRRLVKLGKTWNQLRASVGIDTSGGIAPERFTGGTTTREREFIKSLSPDQRKIYDAAQKDHKENAAKLKSLLSRLRSELRAQLMVNERAHQGKPNAE